MQSNKEINNTSVVIIGAGIAGLCISYFLSKKNINHIILEKGVIANSWVNERWDNFYLVNPNWAMKIPEFDIDSNNFPFDNPDGFLNKKEVINYVQSFAKFIGSKIYENEKVENISKEKNQYKIITSKKIINCNIAVIASGAFGNAHKPEISKKINSKLFQIHSSQYKNSSQLPKGKVIVVGSGQSGAQIAEDLLTSGKEVWLAVSKCGRRPRSYRGKDSSWWNYEMGLFNKTIDEVPFANRWKCSAHTSGSMGGHDINLLDLREKGLNICGTIRECKKDNLIVNDDLFENIKFSDEYAINWSIEVDKYINKKNISTKTENLHTDKRIISDQLKSIDRLNLNYDEDSIIWSTGFRYDYDWIDLDVTDDNNHPIQRRGVTKYKGLYFMGLQWMHSSKSAQFIGVAEDANFIVRDILSKNLL
jgi:putative flavoprotein involved in K+ transport